MLATLSATALLLTAAPLAPSMPQLDGTREAPPRSLPERGEPELQAPVVNAMMRKFMREHQVPGASLAIFRHGDPVYVRSFGWADRETQEAVRPDSLFRIASISKPITAVAILKLVEQGKLQLDANPFALMGMADELAEEGRDPRLAELTIEQLLQHRAGWDRNKSFDPMFVPNRVRKHLGTEGPPSTAQIIRFMLDQRLDFDPGTRYAYSNFGYCLLGRVIEAVSGQGYEEFVQREILQPIGVRGMRLGRSLPEQRWPKEVHYYDQRGRTGFAAVAPGRRVESGYTHDQEVLDAHGGWVASAQDLARFAAAFADPAASPLLSEASIERMWARPAGAEGKVWYGMGWSVRELSEGRLNAWHSGLLTGGTSTLFVRRHDGYTWSILFNSDRSAKESGWLAGKMDPLIHQAVDQEQAWGDTASLASQEAAAPQAPQFQPGQVEVDGQSFPYQLLIPAELEEGKSYPLILFLHGAGERGSDNEAQKRHFPERIARMMADGAPPAFVLAPQCPRGVWWSSRPRPDGPALLERAAGAPLRAAMAALEEVVQTQPIDRDRIALTGLSMGGFGSWELAARRPGWFSGVIPICGGGDPDSMLALAGLPIQVWHGGADTVVPPSASRELVAALQKAKLPVQYFELEGVGHDSWTAAYGDARVLAQLREARRQPLRMLAERTRLLAELVDPQERIAFLGDSITQAGHNAGGYVDLLRKGLRTVHPEIGIIPAGISGHKVPDLLKRYEKDVIEAGATVVFIYIGINDVWHSLRDRGTPIDAFEAGLRELIAGLRASGAEVVLATPSVIGEKTPGQNQLDEMLDAYAAVSRRIAREEGLVLCDLRRSFQEQLRIFGDPAADRGALTRDGVHLTPAGNQWVAIEAAAALREAVARRQAAREQAKD